MLHNLFCFLIFLSFYLCNNIHRFPESIISAARSDSLLSIHLPDTLTALHLFDNNFLIKILQEQSHSKHCRQKI